MRFCVILSLSAIGIYFSDFIVIFVVLILVYFAFAIIHFIMLFKEGRFCDSDLHYHFP